MTEPELSVADPTDVDVATAIDAELDSDERKIGDMWRAQKVDNDTNRIAKEMGWTTVSAVYSYRTYINVLRGKSPAPNNSPTMALQCSRQIKSFILRHPKLSPAAKEILERRRQDCEAVSEADQEPESIGSEYDLPENQAGVYVYTLPHYINHPVAERPDAISTPRTFLKVGKSDRDINIRIKEQSSTALPERPLILRLYQNDDTPADLEEKIHDMLSASDHNPNDVKGAGKEWFKTNLKFLDAIATMLGARIHRYNEDRTTELET